MKFVVGVDGCRGGWLAVKLSRLEEVEVFIFPTFSALCEKFQDASFILVDIPIGLCDDAHGRPCDWLAREILGPRYRSVFPVPCRPAVYATTFDEAIKVNERITGKRIFRATWNIMGKIREVEELLITIPKARKVVREVHPEICFWALSGCQPMKFGKKSEAGFSDRRDVLQKIYPQSKEIISTSLNALLSSPCDKDDLLDALAAAVTGFLGGTRLQTLPPSPKRDSYGLPMEMVYFIPDS